MRFLKIGLIFLLILFAVTIAADYNFISQNGNYIAVWKQESNNDMFEIKESGQLLILKADTQEVLFNSDQKPFNKTNSRGYAIKATVKWLRNDLIYFSRANMGGNSTWKLTNEIYVCNLATKKIFCAKGFNPVFINDSEIRYQYYVFPLTGQYADMCDFRQKTKIKCKTEKLNI